MDLESLRHLDLGERIVKAARMAAAAHLFESVRDHLHRPGDDRPVGGRPEDGHVGGSPRCSSLASLAGISAVGSR